MRLVISALLPNDDLRRPSCCAYYRCEMYSTRVFLHWQLDLASSSLSSAAWHQAVSVLVLERRRFRSAVLSEKFAEICCLRLQGCKLQKHSGQELAFLARSRGCLLACGLGRCSTWTRRQGGDQSYQVAVRGGLTSLISVYPL